MGELTNPAELPVQPSTPDRRAERQPSAPRAHDAPEAQRQDVHDRIQELTGTETADAPSYEATLDTPARPLHQRTEDTSQQQEPDNRNVLLNAENDMDEIVERASELVAMNLEHRVGDFRDYIPIWANVRSHNLATREGSIVQYLQDAVRRLGEDIRHSGIVLDTQPLERAAGKLSVPGGVTKFAATLVPGWRTLHRSIVTPRAENIRSIATELRRELRSRRRAHGTIAA